MINPVFSRKGLRNGFTLVEMAVVLTIVALMIGGLLVPLSAQMDQRNYSQVKQSTGEIKEALLGFAVSNRRLPCPDTDGDGLENPPAPAVADDTPVAGQSTQTFSCPNLEGWLPFQTLGLGRMDSWSNHFLYRVAPAFSNRIVVWSANGAGGTVISDTYFTLASNGNITVQVRGDDPSTAGVTESKFTMNVVTNAAAVIVSHGKNGYGATSSLGNPMAAVPGANVDETKNATAGTTKMARLSSAMANPCSDTAEGSDFCEFDDFVDWVPTSLVISRMVTTGQLP